MPSPVFCVFGRIEHRIEGRLPSFVVGRWVEKFGNETLDFLDARWQASELIAQATQKRMRVGRFARDDVGLREPLVDPMIDRLAGR